MTDYTNADPHNSTTWPTCEDCNLRHATADGCRYPALRQEFGELSDQEDRFLRWVAAATWLEQRNLLSLIQRAKRDARAEALDAVATKVDERLDNRVVLNNNTPRMILRGVLKDIEKLKGGAS